MIEITSPEPSEFAPYYERYVSLVPKGNLMDVLAWQGKGFAATIRGIPEAFGSFRYAPSKWSVNQLVGHVNDAERIFTYRALCFSRGDRAPLPKFEADTYALASAADQRHLADLGAEFEAIRTATLALFRGMTEAMLTYRGIASDNPVTVRALAYIVAGHCFHHDAILKERYLSRAAKT